MSTTPKDLVASEPVMITAILTAVAGFLVTHGVITATQASGLVQAIVPTVVVALGLLVRHYVSPVLRYARTSEVGASAADALTSEKHAAELLAELGLDADGNKLPPSSLS